MITNNLNRSLMISKIAMINFIKLIKRWWKRNKLQENIRLHAYFDNPMSCVLVC